MKNTSIIHLSDLHVRFWHRGKAKLTEKLFKKIRDDHANKLVVITGDITNSGSYWQCKLAKDLLKYLSKNNKVLMVPGNHDYRFLGIGFFLEKIRVKNPFSGSRSADENWYTFLSAPVGFQPHQETWLKRDDTDELPAGLGFIEYENMVIIGIDSGDPDSGIATAEGLVSFKLCCALKELLEKYQDKIRIVLVHHYPFHYGRKTKDFWKSIQWNRMVLKEPHHLLNTLNNNCEILLFGHKHEYAFLKKNSLYVPYIVASNSSTQEYKDKQYKYVKIKIEKRDKKIQSVSAEQIPYKGKKKK